MAARARRRGGHGRLGATWGVSALPVTEQRVVSAGSAPGGTRTPVGCLEGRLGRLHDRGAAGTALIHLRPGSAVLAISLAISSSQRDPLLAKPGNVFR